MQYRKKNSGMGFLPSKFLLELWIYCEILKYFLFRLTVFFFCGDASREPVQDCTSGDNGDSLNRAFSYCTRNRFNLGPKMGHSRCRFHWLAMAKHLFSCSPVLGRNSLSDTRRSSTDIPLVPPVVSERSQHRPLYENIDSLTNNTATDNPTSKLLSRLDLVIAMSAVSELFLSFSIDRLFNFTITSGERGDSIVTFVTIL